MQHLLLLVRLELILFLGLLQLLRLILLLLPDFLEDVLLAFQNVGKFLDLLFEIGGLGLSFLVHV